MNIIKKYTYLLEKHPLKTKMTTAGVIFTSADYLCQKYIEDKQEINWKRVINNGIVGGIVSAPILHWWMNIALQRILQVYLPRIGLLKNASNNTRTIYAVVIDQAIFAPPMQFIYYLSTNYLNFGTLTSGIEAAKNSMPRSLIDSCKLWPFTNYINYGFIPLSYRVLWNNFIGTGWQTYMSYLNSNHKHLSQKRAQLQASKQQSTVSSQVSERVVIDALPKELMLSQQSQLKLA